MTPENGLENIKLSDGDPYLRVAAQIFDVPLGDVTPYQHTVAVHLYKWHNGFHAQD